MTLRILCFTLAALLIVCAPAMAQSRGDNWGHRASDNDYASRNGVHKRMDSDRASSRKDTHRDGIWRESDNENASAQRHAKTKKRGKGTSGKNSNSSSAASRSLND